MAELTFVQLNDGWNADPNAPAWRLGVTGDRLKFSFLLNSYQFSDVTKGDIGCLTFAGCARWRMDITNDHAWFAGEGRYARIAPSWGEFYEIMGDDPALNEPDDWDVIGEDRPKSRHFLFYLRDETFECIADDWGFVRQG